MANQSTPIQNVIESNSNPNPAINETNLSTAQQILQKYNEMERGDADVQRQQVNNNVQQRQLDPGMQQQQRIMELEQRAQMNNAQQNAQQNVQQNSNKKEGSILNKLNVIISKSQDKLKDVVIVVVLFISLNMNIVNTLLGQYIPFILGEDGNVTMNGIIIKGVLTGILFYIISTLLLVL